MTRRGVAGAAIALLLACGAGDERAALESEPAASAPLPVPEVETQPALASDLGALRALVGRYPHEVQLFDREPLARRLRALLGEAFATLLGNTEVVEPLREADGVLYVTGIKSHSGGSDAAALVIDPARDVIWVWLLVGGEPEFLTERDVELVVPEAVRAVIEGVEPEEAPDAR